MRSNEIFQAFNLPTPTTSSRLKTTVGHSRRNAGVPSIFVLLVILVILGGGLLALRDKGIPFNILPISGTPQPSSMTQFQAEVKKFTSDEEFKSYMAAAQALTTGAMGNGVVQLPTLREGIDIQGPISAGRAEEVRISETNVQVRGIDEPDVVKTDGQRIYLSSNFYYFNPQIRAMPVERGLPPDKVGETKIIKAFPPADLKKEASIAATGELLLYLDRLVVFSGQSILSYDVSNPVDPVEKWKQELESRVNLVTSRLYQGKLYVVTRTGIEIGNPCPVPILGGSNPLSVPCTDIYHPIGHIPTDVMFTAMIIDPIFGTVEKRVTFVGSSSDSVVYMSSSALYITYTNYPDMVTFLYRFYTGVGSDLVSSEIRVKLAKLASYDLSPQAKLTELQYILEKYYATLSQDERLRVENEMNNRLAVFAKEKARELTTSGIVKVELKNFSIIATGTVPGQPLNQFSLDEYDKNLRVAVTFEGGFDRNESASDVYILNETLKELGSVKDLGVGERIYSVRFIADRGYVVTFKQIDPFYVLDLSNPLSPQKRGELKIPGFSSYLHPLAANRILGVGQENTQVKLSLFDVSNPDNPTEVGKYLLDEYWTEVSNNHHAFLQDAIHQVFFIPGSKGAYIFAYKSDQLRLTKAVSDIIPKRAVYINNYFYIIAENKIIVMNENDWSTVNQLEF